MFYKQIASMLIVLSMLVSCAKHEVEDLTTKTGTISLATTLSTTLKSDVSVDAILVSITSPDGQVVMDNKRIQLYSLGREYFTEGIKIEVGAYLLTGFVVVDRENNVVYMAPKQGSEYAHVVNNPLPIKFMIYPEEDTRLVPEVVDMRTCDCTSSDLGYLTFSFNVKDCCVDSCPYPKYVLHTSFLNYAWGAVYNGSFLSEDGVIRTFEYGDAQIKDPVSEHLIPIKDGYVSADVLMKQYKSARVDGKIAEHLRDSIVVYSQKIWDVDLYDIPLGMADFGSYTVYLYTLDESLEMYEALKLYEYSDMVYEENQEMPAQALLAILERYKLLERYPIPVHLQEVLE